MAVSMKKSWKLQDFVAHGDKVNCLALGNKSSRVLATGGEDRKVNLWTVNKSTCVMSLTGHSHPIEAVQFGNDDENIAAGSSSGSLKIWDLEAAKIIRTLSGHKSGVRALDFHPYGNFVASGSLDSNIKLWDIKRKGCIFTYKGHDGPVNNVQFTPDGRWVASCGDDGSVKVWDLAAGQLLANLCEHGGPVNAVQFHPREFLLASCGQDRCVKYWDLESFALVCSTDSASSSPIKTIRFHPEGMCLYAGTADYLKVFTWEPESKQLDSLSVGWGKIAAMSIGESQTSQLIGASINQTNVGTFCVDVNRLPPFATPERPLTAATSNRKNFNARRPSDLENKAKDLKQNKPKEDPIEDAQDDATENASSRTEINSLDDYQEFFKPRKQIPRSPKRNEEPFPAPKEDTPGHDRLHHREPVRKDRFAAEAKPEDPKGGINMADFLPKKSNAPTAMMSDLDAVAQIKSGHNSMMSVLGTRQRNLQVVRALWTSGNIKTALDSAITMHDPAVLVDLLNVLILKVSLWDLSVCAMLLPELRSLLASKYDTYVQTSCNALKLVLRNFSSTIKESLQSPSAIGIDLSAEERLNRCRKCYDLLQKIRGDVEKRLSAGGKLTRLYKEILMLIKTLD